MLCRLALALVCGLGLASPSLADDNPPSSSTTHIPARHQADWKLVSEAITPVPVNRIFYARVPSQTNAWKSRLSLYDRTSQVQQDFTHTGLLAIFLTSRALDFTIDGVYASEDGSLSVQIRAGPPPPPPPCTGEVCVVPIIRTIPGGSLYLLIAIRKDSLPAPVKRLYISEVADPSPVVIHDPPPPPPASVTIGPTPSSEPAVRGVVPPLWKNCTRVHRRYPHGVGKLRAHDRTSGTPVTTFRRSTRLYNIAMRYNRGLDADKDGIACEAR
jgi:hypothetical protein